MVGFISQRGLSQASGAITVSHMEIARIYAVELDRTGEAASTYHLSTKRFASALMGDREPTSLDSRIQNRSHWKLLRYWTLLLLQT